MCRFYFLEMNTCLADFCGESFENYHGVRSAKTNLREDFFSQFNRRTVFFFRFFIRPLYSIVVTALNGSLYKNVSLCARHCLLNIKITHDAIKQYFHNLPVIRPHLCGYLRRPCVPAQHLSLRKAKSVTIYRRLWLFELCRIIGQSKIRSWAQPSKILLA